MRASQDATPREGGLLGPAFVALGTMCVLAGLGFGFLAAGSVAHAGHDLSRGAWLAPGLVILGVGAAFKRRAALVLLAAPCLALGCVVLFASATRVPPGARLASAAVGLGLLAPAALTVRGWRVLR